MADQKFTVEEILNEYSADGSRSGIRRSEQTPLAHGTLETEKLVSAATSDRPLRRERTGYQPVVHAAETAPEEDLVDIKSTISQIKATKAEKAAREADAAPILRERFPTQQLRREKISFIHADSSRDFRSSYLEEDGYDSAVKHVESNPDGDVFQERTHRPNVRQMQDSTRAKEKRRKRRRGTEASYSKESVTGEFNRAKPYGDGWQETAPRQNRELEGEQIYYEPTGQQTSAGHSVRQRVRSNAFGERTAGNRPDDLDLVRKSLHNLRNVVFFRFLALLVLTLLGVLVICGESLGGGFLVRWLTPRGEAILQLGLAAAGAAVAFPTLLGGLRNFFRFRADSDSMAALPLLPAAASAVCGIIDPSILESDAVHLYVPCALLALLLNAVGRLLVVRRALRNCSVISHETQKRVLSYVSQEETAELFTRGVLNDYPIVTAVRKADGLCDILRYSYSSDMADGVCRPMTPICAGVCLLVSAGITVIRMGTAFQMEWIGFFLSLLTLLLTACCCMASALVVNLPLEWESKKAAASGSAMLGYQSVDDFFDTNALLAEATDLFPSGSVQIQGMKIFSGAKVDDVLLDTASLVCHADSILQNAFSEMIPDKGALRQTEQFVCEDGLGLCGWIANRRILLGGREMMANHNIEGLPTKTREAELAEGSGDVLYLSVSGVLSAMFSIRITADPKVIRQMQALRQEQVALVLRSVDSSVTLRRISELFDYPESLLKILPVSMHHLFQRETADLGCVSASMTVGGTGFGAATLLLGARRVRRAAVMGMILQIVSALLGFSLAMIHVITGSYEEMTAQFFFLYHLILTAVTALAVRVR